jgi:hypothetical protein
MKRTWLWAGVGVVVLALLYLPSLGIGGWQVFGWLLFLLCPLIHLFGFHGAHGHGGQAREDDAAGNDGAPRSLQRRDEV